MTLQGPLHKITVIESVAERTCMINSEIHMLYKINTIGNRSVQNEFELYISRKCWLIIKMVGNDLMRRFRLHRGHK